MILFIGGGSLHQGCSVLYVSPFYTGYRTDANDPTMWVYTDYTDKGLNHFVAQLIDTYVHVPVDYSSCGYGCSDHVSWSTCRISL